MKNLFSLQRTLLFDGQTSNNVEYIEAFLMRIYHQMIFDLDRLIQKSSVIKNMSIKLKLTHIKNSCKKRMFLSVITRRRNQKLF